MTNDTIQEAERKRDAAVKRLAEAKQRESAITRRLGFATSEGIDTTQIKLDLADVRDAITGLEAALPVYAEAIENARLDASADRYGAIRDQLDVVIAKRREAAQAAQLAMSDLCDAVNQVAALGRQTVSLAKQLGGPHFEYPDRLGNHHTLPQWLAANCYAISPEGAAGWPNGGASPHFASAGLPALEEECLVQGGL